MNLIELVIFKMEHSVSYSNSYAIILFEKNGNKTLPIIIGPEEARSIAIGIEKIDTPRPLTHDLILNLLKDTGHELLHVHIDKIVDGIFHSKLICRNIETGFQSVIDSRTSDAIALAVRTKCKIFIDEKLIEEAGVEYQGEITEADEDELVQPNTQSRSLEDLSATRLNELLEEMLTKEDYEEAARIRDAIKRKKS